MTDASFDAAAAIADFRSAATCKPAWPPKQDGRTLQKVRRGSLPAEMAEAFYRPTSRRTCTLIMRGAERMMKHTMSRRTGKKRWGDMTPIALQVLEVLLFKATTWKTGACSWSYDQLMRATMRSRQAVSEALTALETLGILERMRRFIRLDVEGKGPQVEQTSNAYRFTLTRGLQALLGLGATPMPDDAKTAILAGRQAQDIMETDATGKPTLGSALAAMERAVRQRVSRI